jgi:hypothetical protein
LVLLIELRVADTSKVKSGIVEREPLHPERGANQVLDHPEVSRIDVRVSVAQEPARTAMNRHDAPDPAILGPVELVASPLDELGRPMIILDQC